MIKCALAASELRLILHDVLSCDRVKACIKYGIFQGSSACDDIETVNTSPSSTANIIFPENESYEWKDLISTSNIHAANLPGLEFTTSQIIAYFVDRSVCDNQPAGDVKSI